jgi:predicted membrane channel-forming protein YqfA (hemolysin III family)
MCWVRSPKWLSAAIGIVLGWVGVVALPQLARNEGLVPILLVACQYVAVACGVPKLGCAPEKSLICR